MMSYMSFSQDLKPKLHQIDEQWHFCFTFSQSLKIAELLETGAYNETLVKRLSQSNQRYQVLAKQKDEIIGTQKKKVANLLLVSENYERSQRLWQERLQARDRIIKRSKLHKTLLSIGVVVLGTIVITK